MTPEARAELQRIGAELDGHRQVRVKVGGIVLPEPTPDQDQKANENEQHEQRQPREREQRERGPRQQREQRQSRGRQQREPRRRQQRPGPRSPGAATHLGSVELRPHYDAQVVQLAKAYPSAKVVAADEQGMWLQVESAVLDGIDRSATFLVVLPFATSQFPRAWGFWNMPDGPQWIGNRHTNFPDGSVCAFVPESGAWVQGGQLDALIDLYTVWALRQLYLEEFKRWPGRQFSPHPFYALFEFKDDEFCSCDKEEPPRLYGECCKPEHLAADKVELMISFERKMRCRLGDRTPPPAVVDFINGKGPLPTVAKALRIPASVVAPVGG